jgi:Leu/Phe-tRNA-protein transferase
MTVSDLYEHISEWYGPLTKPVIKLAEQKFTNPISKVEQTYKFEVNDETSFEKLLNKIQQAAETAKEEISNAKGNKAVSFASKEELAEFIIETLRKAQSTGRIR